MSDERPPDSTTNAYGYQHSNWQAQSDWDSQKRQEQAKDWEQSFKDSAQRTREFDQEIRDRNQRSSSNTTTNTTYDSNNDYSEAIGDSIIYDNIVYFTKLTFSCALLLCVFTCGLIFILRWFGLH
jgi:hypothetical protein